VQRQPLAFLVLLHLVVLKSVHAARFCCAEQQLSAVFVTRGIRVWACSPWVVQCMQLVTACRVLPAVASAPCSSMLFSKGSYLWLPAAGTVIYCMQQYVFPQQIAGAAASCRD
jgi:hypothetical protein